MVKDDSIFNLRFGSNPKLHPSDEDVRSFLESKKEGTKTAHREDFKSYWELLSGLAEYKLSGSARMGEKMLYTIVAHSHFARPALKAAVEEYKYHVHSLLAIDFKKPAAFIRSAEAEMARLNAGKKEEAARLDRMRGMVEDRKKMIEDQRKKWLEIAEELNNLISYVSDNLRRIQRLCEQSITILVSEQVDRTKELGLIEDIKTEFKDRLKESLRKGTITKEQMEQAKEAVSDISGRTANLVRGDIFTMTQLYEKIHGHVRTVLENLTKIAGEIAAGKHEQPEADGVLYQQAEGVMISLVTGISFEVTVADIEIVNEHDRMLVEKRNAMFDHLTRLLEA